jgi:hypothetical protein
VVKNNWYVITGTTAKGYEFYKKYFVFTSDKTDEDGWWIYFDFVYPRSEYQFTIRLLPRSLMILIPNYQEIMITKAT